MFPGQTAFRVERLRFFSAGNIGSSDHCTESATDSAAVILNECCYDPLTVVLVFMKVPLPPEYIVTGSGAGVGLVFVAGAVT